MESFESLSGTGSRRVTPAAPLALPAAMIDALRCAKEGEEGEGGRLRGGTGGSDRPDGSGGSGRGEGIDVMMNLRYRVGRVELERRQSRLQEWG